VRDLAGFSSLLQGAPREAAGPTAPAHGLFLWDVSYGNGKQGLAEEESE
jgi:tRNA U38,U39,U40 pseudouridine synthase TruA